MSGSITEDNISERADRILGPEDSPFSADFDAPERAAVGCTVRDRLRGSLLAGAVGDAFGYPIEFVRGSRAVTDRYTLAPASGRAIISDDTQMTLFTACGMLACTGRSRTEGCAADFTAFVRYAYLDWLETQSLKAVSHPTVSWIKPIPELNKCRAPGNTCINALSAGGGSRRAPINNSKGCGSVMRVAPIALCGAATGMFSREQAAGCCAETSAITHCHPLGWLPSAALGSILYDLVYGCSLDYAVENSVRFLREAFGDEPYAETMAELIEKARSLAAASADGDAAEKRRMVGMLGEGWVAEEALAVAVYSVLACRDSGFDSCLVTSACHDGDSDSTASIAGQIWGAAYGIQSVPEKWLEPLELREVITEIADDLAVGCPVDDSGRCQDPAWEKKYIRIAAD